MSRRIVILGAGVTGLAAAWKLLDARPQDEVIILERDSVPGGLAKSVDWNGYKLDLGPHRLHTEIPEIHDFFLTFCEKQLIRVKRASRMWINGCYIPYPIKALPTFLALGPMYSMSFGLSALATLFQQNGKDAASYEEYVSKYYGEKLYRHIFAPFAQKVWGVHPDRIAAETARVRLRGDTIWSALLDGFLSKEETYVSEFLYPRGGIGDIADQFAGQIAERGGCFHYNRTVTRIETDEEHPRVITESPDGDETYEYDYLVYTLPLPRLVDFIEPAPEADLISASNDLNYRAIVLIYLMYEGKFPLDDTWLYYPEEHVRFSRVSVPDNFNPARAIPDKTCFCLEFTCDYNDATWNEEPDSLAKHGAEMLKKSGLVDREYADFTAVKIRDGYPVYTVGYEASLNRLLTMAREKRSILLVGRQGLFRHNNIDQSIQMGLLAADELATDQVNFTNWYDKIDQFNDYRIVD